MDQFLQVVIFRLKLLALQTGELAQTHLHDGVGLRLGEAELLHKAVAGLENCLGGTDVLYDKVDNVQRLEQTFQYVGALFGLVKIEFGAAHNHLVAMTHEIVDEVLEREQTGFAVYQRDVVDREAGLYRSVLVQVAEHHVAGGTYLELDYNAHTLAVALVVDVCDALYLLVLYQLRDFLYHLALVHLVGNLADDDCLASAVGNFYFCLGTDHDAAAASFEGILDALKALDDAAGGEIGALDVLHQFLYRDLGIIDICTNCVADLGEVVGRHIGSHTHGDTVAAVEQQHGSLCGEHDRFHQRFVKVGSEIYGILVEVGEDILCQTLQFGLCVTHRSRGIAVDTAKVALAENQRIAHTPGLGKTHHSVVYAAVAVRVVFTKHITHDTGRLFGGAAVSHAQSVHTVKHAAVDRFHTVPDIGQRT